MNYLRFICLFLVIVVNSASERSDCNEKISILCQSSHLIHGLIDKLNAVQAPVVIYPGIEIVLSNATVKSGMHYDIEKNRSIVEKILSYLKFHEVNIKLNRLLDVARFLNVFNIDDKKDQLTSESRKKDDKMHMVAISLLFGKIMAFLKIGSIGALAMKALGISSMALLFSVMLGLKSLQQSSEQTSHHVQYISDGHHRRRKRHIGRQRKMAQAWPFAN